MINADGRNTFGDGPVVQQITKKYEFEFAQGRWYRSKDKRANTYSDFVSYMLNKKWWLEEQMNVHMMRLQQVKSLC